MYARSTNTDFARWTSFNFRFILFFFVLSFLPFAQSYGQSPFCTGATELCPAEGITYPASTGVGNAPVGNDYGCLGSEPNPAWFYVEISQPGNIDIALTNSNNEDIDFAMWGPFSSLPTALSNCGSLSAPIDCSYNSSSSEAANIPNSSAGEVYLLMITNFSDDPTEINGVGTGTGVATCDGVCFANGGSLDQADISGCVGDANLNTSISPNYPFSMPGPSSFTYGYTFLVSNAAGVIMFTLDGPNLGSLPPGDFTICGLSYRLIDALFVATAIGQTVSSLQASFDNETASFCGDTSDDCFDVTIGIPGPPIIRDTIGCLGDFIDLPNGGSYPVPGVYTYPSNSGSGCGQDITYIVAPVIPTIEVVDEIVCEGQCINIDDVDYCDPTQAVTLVDESGCNNILILNLLFIAVSSEIAEPDMLSCTNQTVTLDGSASDGNEFEWRDEANNLLGTTTSLDVTSVGCYTLTAINNTVTPSCTAETTVCVTQDGGGTVTTPIPTGTTPICTPNSGTYSITPETDVDYTWTVSGNGSIGTGQGTEEITVDWTSAGTANVCVTASNSCGAGTQECFPVTINEVPVDPTIIGDTPICPTGTGSYSVALDATVTTYSWTVPTGASITSGDNTESISVSFGNTAGDVCVVASNACGDATQECFPVALFDLPADADVSGPMDICPGQTVTYTTPSDVNTTMYNWTIPTCATIDSGQGSNSITVTWGATCTAAGDICVDVSNTCGTGQGDCFPVSLSTITETPTVSTTAASACACDITMASVTDAATATNIVWSVPTGATITGGQGTASITIDWCGAQSGDICAELTYACGTVEDCSPVTISPTPTANAGTDNAICGLTYDLNATASIGSGTWSYTGAGTANFLNASTAQTAVTVGDFGSYTFTWTENNNSCIDTDEVTIDFNASPMIDGGITETCNGTNTAYIISFTVTSGALPYSTTGIAGTWTGDTFTSDEITSGDTYTFTISDANTCISQEYNGIFTCDCETDAGTMQVEQLEACIDQTVTATHNGDETLDANDISQFILHNGDPIGGVIFAANNTGEFGLVAPMIAETTYFISLAVGDNDGTGNVDLNASCAGFTEGVPIIFHDYPTPVAGADDATCELTYDLSVMPDAAGGSWSQTGGTGAATFADVNAPNTNVTVSETGIYTFIWSENNSGCLGSDDVVITFNPSPEITGNINEVCNGTNTAYAITFDVTGGTSAYTASGITGTWTGDTFTSDEITSGDTYTFTISDANTCISQEYNGIFTCDCETDAGTMQVEQLEACIDQTVTATHNGDEVLDANDISQFILHSGDPISGVIFAANNTGEFGLVAPMLAETTYFVSFAVGDNDGTGNVDLNASCAGFTEGVPIIFHDYPTPVAGADDATCELTYDLSVMPDAAGGSWSQTDGTGTAAFTDVNAPNTNVTVSETGTYTFTWSEDNNGCLGSDDVEITFNPSPEITGGINEVCNGTNTAYTITFDVTGGTSPYTASGITGTWTGDTFTSIEITSGDTYTFTISDANTCVSQEYNGIFICDCETDAGTMQAGQLEACIDQTVTATHNGDEVLDANDISQFILHNGDPIGGVIFAANNTGEFGLIAPMIAETTYFVSFAVGDNDGTGNVDLNAACAGFTEGVPVIFHDYPAPVAGADDATCDLTYNISVTSDVAGGSWSQTGGTGTTAFTDVNAQITTVTVSETGTYTFTWSEDNGGCLGSDEIEITFNPSPEITGDIDEVCNGINTAYTITFEATGGTLPYITTGIEGTWVGAVFTCDEIPSGDTYTFSITDANGCISQEYNGIFTCDCETDAGTIQLNPLNACSDQTVTAIQNGDQVLDANDISQFILYEGNPIDGVILAANNTGTFAFTPPLVAGTTYFISCAVGDDDGTGNVDLNAACSNYTEGVPVTFYNYPTPSAGSNDATCSLTYTLSATPDVTGGSWSQTAGVGTAIFDDASAANTSVTVSEIGDYVFTWTEDNFGCVGSDIVGISFNESPTVEGLIEEICNNTNTAYTVSFTVTGGIAPYSATGIPGTWEENVFTSAELVSGANYTFSIEDTNTCVSQEYNGSHICDCETDAGTMSLELLEACIDQAVTAIHNDDETLDGDDVSQYLLHDGDAVNGQIFDMNTTGVFSFVTPMQTETTYFISLAVGNDDGNGNVDLTADCTDVAQGQPVIFYAYPTPEAGANDDICALTYDLSATPVFAGGMWSSTDATVIFADATDANTSVTVTTFGTYDFVWTESNNSCEGSDEVTITFNAAPELAAPQVETCDLATNDYNVTFSITGGLAPYFVDGVMIAGTDFTSNSIGSNVPYSFEVTDANGCGPITVTGVRNCDCQSDAGTMEQALQEACINETVTGLPLGDEVNDGDDVVQYILHDGNGTIAGTIFETSDTPTFGLVSPMTTGVTYYISTIIGNDLGGGIVDMNDPCFRVAVGTPVIFNPLPDGNISGSEAICEGGSTDISFDLTGTAPFSIVIDGVTLTNQAATFTQTVSPLATTDYTLTEVTDANGCVQTVNSIVTITVNTPPSATIDAATNVCNSSDNGNTTSLNFSDFITAGDATGTWQDSDASGALGNYTSLDFAGVTPGDYTFIYTTGAATAPCTNVSYTTTIIVEDCVCPSVATSAPDALCNDGGNLDLTTLQVTNQAGTWAIISQPDGADELLNGNNFATTGIPTGDYTFEFTLSNMPPDGCPTTSQEILTVNQAVSAGTPNAALNFCETDAMNVSLNDEILDANIGGEWTEISPNPSIGNAFNANTGIFNPNNQSIGTYTFRYTVTGAAPCGDDFSEISVTISPAPTANAGEDDEITCEKQEIILGGNATQGDNISYLWEATNGGVLNSDEINSSNPSTLTGGTYILTVTNDLTGCSDTDDVVIAEAVELPMPFFTISDISCFGESDGVITIDSVAGGQPPYVYSLDGENFNTNTFFSSLSGGDYTISVQDVNGCLNDISFEFPEPNEVFVELFAVLEDDNTIRFGDSIALNIIPSVDFDSLESVVWTPAAVLSCDTCQMTWAMPFETTNFSVTIEDDGCVATDNFTLVVKRDAPIFVPTAFSPNNNGNNEVLMIFASDQVAKVNEFLIFNRWGEAVHEYYQFLPNDPAFGWDGTWRGEPMNSNVFTWYAEIELIDGRIEVVKGDVTLMR